jgi:DnaK suppressor protein
MAAKKASGKAVKHRAAAPKKVAAKRAKPARAKVVARRPAAPSPRRAADVHRPAKTVAKARSAERAPDKHPDRSHERARPLEKPRTPLTAFVMPSHRPVSVLPAAEGEDAEADAAASLLAGPRNVKPYIAKRGEQYMNKEQLDHFRVILLTWKRDLMEEVDRTVLHMKDEAANFPDPNDRATQESEFSLELRTRDRERKLIRKIEEALKRIDDGTYGYCLETGEEIGIKRLEARPVATLSVEAQERRERREKQFGDRDDRYR